tara:strand:+ start:5495 stop:6118 length:624 start_codon:yes stop_codon:yes gene_type:complete
MRFQNSLIIFTTIVLLGAHSKSLAQESTDRNLPSDVVAALEVLEDSADRFRNVVGGIRAVDWQFRSKDFRHSIAEEAEHAALAHQSLQSMVRRSVGRDPNPERARELVGKKDLIKREMLHGPMRPENYQPKGTLLSKAEVLEYFESAHAKAVRLLKVSQNLKVHVYKHPSPTYGELTALQWFYYIAYHTGRHTQMIQLMTELPEFHE